MDMGKTPFTRRDFLSLLDKKKKKKKKKKGGGFVPPKMNAIRGFPKNRIKKSSIAKHLNFVKQLANPKSTVKQRRKVLSQVITDKKTGAGKLRAVKELITNVYNNSNNLPINRNKAQRLKKQYGKLRGFLKCRTKKGKVKVLHENCKKGGFLPLLGLAAPFLLKEIGRMIL